jgi:hypothetical protein
MSHHFKYSGPSHAEREEAAIEDSIRRQAALLRDQAELDELLDGASDQMRQAMIERLAPYLHFVPEDETPVADCPTCGMKRGSLIPHDCAN